MRVGGLPLISGGDGGPPSARRGIQAREQQLLGAALVFEGPDSVSRPGAQMKENSLQSGPDGRLLSPMDALDGQPKAGIPRENQALSPLEDEWRDLRHPMVLHEGFLTLYGLPTTAGPSRIYEIDDFFGAAKPRGERTATGKMDTQDLGNFTGLLLNKLGLTLKTDKCEFQGKPRLEVLGILFNTGTERYLRPPNKDAKIMAAAGSLLRYSSRNQVLLNINYVKRFARMANKTALAVTDCRLRLRKICT